MTANRKQLAADARKAYAIAPGITSDRYIMRLPEMLAAACQEQSPKERGATYQLGTVIEKDGYLFLYKVIDALGCRVISTLIHSDGITIMCRHKTYEGQSQPDLLLEIIQDCIDNFGILSGLNHDWGDVR
jgi:hypothetical protein